MYSVNDLRDAGFSLKACAVAVANFSELLEADFSVGGVCAHKYAN